MSEFNRLQKTRHGMMIYNQNDTFVGRSIQLYGEFSEGEIDFFKQVVRPGNVVVDIGANIGSHTLFFANAVGLTGAVYAFEPQRVVFQTLCGNMALNSVMNAVCYQAAIGEHPGTTVIPLLDYRLKGNFGRFSLGSYTAGEKVPVMTLDSLNLPRCDFIKIDVEGMEREVVAGCLQTIKRFSPTLYVENDREEKSADLIRYIDSIDYAMFIHTTALFNPNNYLANPENVFGGLGSTNMLCVPKSRAHLVAGSEPVAVPPL